MINDNFTKIPNVLFDQLLKELNNSELKILLVIFRQTYGWIDKRTNLRKRKDRISSSQFILKTGLSRRVISSAIKSLSQQNLIQITDKSGNDLCSAARRKGKSYIYYSSSLDSLISTFFLDDIGIKKTNICKRRHKHVQKVIHNKRNLNKRNIIRREISTDYKHIGEILEEKLLKWKPRIKE